MQIKTSPQSVSYEEAISFMEKRVDGIIKGEEDEIIWLLEHPALYTSGTSAKRADLINQNAFPVYEAGRGGQYTYHGPGQRVVYIMWDLKKHFPKPDLRVYVKFLENWIIRTLAHFKVEAFVREGRIGVWVDTNNGEKKIAAIGIRVRKWVAYHGISININPDLGHYNGIVPCGISDYGVTSLQDLGINVSMQEFDEILIKNLLPPQS